MLWFRLADVALKATSFTFGTVLCIYLLGMAAGTVAGVPVARRVRDPLRVFLRCQAGILVWAGAAVVALARLPSVAPAVPDPARVLERAAAVQPRRGLERGHAHPLVCRGARVPLRRADVPHGDVVRRAAARGARRRADQRPQGRRAPGLQHRGVRGGDADRRPRRAGLVGDHGDAARADDRRPRLRGRDGAAPPAGLGHAWPSAARWSRWRVALPGAARAVAAAARRRWRRGHGRGGRDGHGGDDPRRRALEPVGERPHEQLAALRRLPHPARRRARGHARGAARGGDRRPRVGGHRVGRGLPPRDAAGSPSTRSARRRSRCSQRLARSPGAAGPAAVLPAGPAHHHRRGGRAQRPRPQRSPLRRDRDGRAVPEQPVLGQPLFASSSSGCAPAGCGPAA